MTSKQHEFRFCKICRLNHNQGKGHKYSVKHKQALSLLLGKFLNKIQDVLFFLKNPVVLLPEQRLVNRFWCVPCEKAISEHDSIFACCNAIKHLASPEHMASLRCFWTENGGDVQKRDLYCISDQDVKKWEDQCKAIHDFAAPKQQISPSNNIHLIHSSILKDKSGKFPLYTFSNNLSENVQPLQVYTGKKLQVDSLENNCSSVARSSLDSKELQSPFNGVQTADQNAWQDGQKKTLIHLTRPTDSIYNGDKGKVFGPLTDFRTEKPGDGNGMEYSINAIRTKEVYWENDPSPDLLDKKQVQYLTSVTSPSFPDETISNVHTGAHPPWLDTAQSSEDVICERTQLLSEKLQLSKSQERKLKKLKNPKRVGAAWAEKRRAELEREQRGEPVTSSTSESALWLPNFGRVWQSGSRKDSRKEFEAENKRKQMLSPANTNEAEIQPYISKRMRMESKENASNASDNRNGVIS